MDRNEKPNPFAAFDSMSPKVAAPVTGPKKDNNAFGNSFASPAAPTGFSATPGAFAPSALRPTNQISAFDDFGFPITAVQPQATKANQFDVFASKPIIPTRPPAPSGETGGFSASSNGSGNKTAPSREIQDPFASINNSPIKPLKPVSQQPTKALNPFAINDSKPSKPEKSPSMKLSRMYMYVFLYIYISV
jgi:hypothetical protein